MDRQLKKSAKMTYWLVIVVLLFFEHSAAMALAVCGVRNGNKVDIVKTVTPESCSDWEEFDGIGCVCASNSAGCSDDGGMVCDNQDRQYRSSCFYSLRMCQQHISIDHNIESCDACVMLRLTGGNKYPKGTTLANFRREGPKAGLSTRYKCINDKETEVFFSVALNAWIIGKSSSNDSFVYMIQSTNVSFPGDGFTGMLIPNHEGTDITWEYDETLRLECVQGPSPGGRIKRFIFLAIFVGVSLATTVTTTTLHVLQAEKGCLYYPSVCDMRDEIKYHLLPELSRDKDRFQSSYGEPKEFKQIVDKIFDQIVTIQASLIQLPELHTTLNTTISTLVQTYYKINDDDLNQIDGTLSLYDEMQTSAAVNAVIGKVFLDIQMITEMPLLVAESVSMFALTMAGIGAVIGFGFGIVDVISSVKEEKKVRDSLREKKNVLIRARSTFDHALNNMKTFQQNFCQFVVKYFEELSEKGKLYFETFDSLYSFISRIYGHSKSRCCNPDIVANSNLKNFKTLLQDILQPMVKILTGNITSLKDEISKIRERKAFLDEIYRQITSEKQDPAVLFQFIKTNRPKNTNNMFGHLFKLVKFISTSVLPTETCYWGHNLDKIRSGLTTIANFTSVPICSCDELRSIDTVIKAAVHDIEPICKIHRQIQGSVFRNIYQTVRFIAENILPMDNCYWGYDLDDIRGAPNATEVNSAKVDYRLISELRNFDDVQETPKTAHIRNTTVKSDLISTLLKLGSVNQIAFARQAMEETFSIYSKQWQNFLFCHVWENQATLSDLKCGSIKASSICIPASSNFSIC